MITNISLQAKILRTDFLKVRLGLRGQLNLQKVAVVKKSGPQNKISRILPFLLIFFGLLTGLFVFGPQLYYRVFPQETKPIVAEEKGTPMGGDFQASASAQPRVLPAYDAALPEGDWLVIPRIGVRTQLRKTDDSEDALKQGVWWVPDFGSPSDTEKPMIVVAHRFGYQWWWKSEYWRYNSFYLLPELEPGDNVEVIMDHRKWVYEIYAGEEGTEITDYQANLILYTCKYLNSSIRHFRYARLIDQTKDSQSVL